MTASPKQFVNGRIVGGCSIHAEEKWIGPHERHWSLLPLMMLGEWIFGAIFFFRTLADPTYEPRWPLRVTGELEEGEK